MKKFRTAIIAAAAGLMLMGCSSQKEETVAPESAAETTAEETTARETAAEATEAETDTEEADTEAPVEEETTVTLAAAASLEYAFTEELIPMFEEENPGIKIEGTYDSSGKLQTQIESGLEADIFFSAAEKQMNALNDEGFIISDSIVNLLENKIVLILPSDSENGEISAFEDITKASSIALGDPESVPVGQYSEESLTNLGIWDEIQDKVSFGTNVTEVLNWVAESSADCGIVYATDAATTDKVKVVSEAPEGSLESPVVYPVARLSDDEAAVKFYDFICSDEAMAVFEEYGFADNR